MLTADPTKVRPPSPCVVHVHATASPPRPLCHRPQVSRRAKKRGLPQLGTLGAGNHYAEIQVVDEVFDRVAASKMGIDRIGQVRYYPLALLKRLACAW